MLSFYSSRAPGAIEETIGRVERLSEAGAGEARIVRALLGGESLVGRASRGEYSRTAFVRAVLHEALGGASSGARRVAVRVRALRRRRYADSATPRPP